MYEITRVHRKRKESAVYRSQHARGSYFVGQIVDLRAGMGDEQRQLVAILRSLAVKLLLGFLGLLEVHIRPLESSFISSHLFRGGGLFGKQLGKRILLLLQQIVLRLGGTEVARHFGR